MKARLTVLWHAVVLFSIVTLAAPNVTFTWNHGPNKVNQTSVVGTVGIMAPENLPAARYAHCTTFRESANQIYLFGGINSVQAFLTNMWMFDVDRAQWVLVKSTQSGVNTAPVRGTKGVPDVGNSPGGLSLMGCAFSPADQNIYVFGGYGALGTDNYFFSDLWRYNPSDNRWTWLSGNGTFASNVRPTLYVENDSIFPAPRASAGFATHLSLPLLFVHGGDASLVNGNYSRLSDLWQFNIVTGKWSLISGSITPDIPAVYGTINVEDAANTPGSRSGHSMVVMSGGDIYLYGGCTAGNVGTSDVWRFTLKTSRQWVYVTGSKLLQTAANYGPLGESGTNYTPGTRKYYSMSQLGALPQIVLVAGGQNGYQKNDVWLLDLSSSNWTYFAGSAALSSKGTYGTKGLYTNGSMFGGRMGFGMSCNAAGEKCLVYGGMGVDSLGAFGLLSDTWRIDIFQAKSNIGMSSSSLGIATATSIEKRSSVINYPSTSANPAKSATSTYVLPAATKDSAAETANLNGTIDVIPGVSLATAGILLVLIVILCCAVAFLIYLRKRGSRANSNTKRSRKIVIAHDRRSTTVSSVDTSSTIELQMTKFSIDNTNTVMSTEKEFAMPGFLEFHAGEDFRWEQKIAQGGGGGVFLGRGFAPKLLENNNGGAIIVKIMSKSLSTQERQAFDQEVTTMHFLSGHRNIALLLGWSSEPLAILMKYYKHGTLKNYVKNGKLKTKSALVSCLMDISRGLQFMHSHEVAHCDIKPDNVLLDVDSDGRLVYVLSDFGIAAIFAEEVKLVHAFNAVNLNGVTIIYAAPEAINRYRSGLGTITKMEAFSGDVFSTSLIAYMLLHLAEPWRGKFITSTTK